MQQVSVWLVEDEQGIADTLIYMLQQEGFSVEAFERGLPALEKARHQCPDVAILDVGLPDISGFELCRRLLEYHPALPILFLTARSDEVDRLLGLETVFTAGSLRQSPHAATSGEEVFHAVACCQNRPF